MARFARSGLRPVLLSEMLRITSRNFRFHSDLCDQPLPWDGPTGNRIRENFHYACSKCHGVVPSRFIYEGHLPSLQVNHPPGVDEVEKGLDEEDGEERQVERRAVEERLDVRRVAPSMRTRE